MTKNPLSRSPLNEVGYFWLMGKGKDYDLSGKKGLSCGWAKADHKHVALYCATCNLECILETDNAAVLDSTSYLNKSKDFLQFMPLPPPPS